MRAPSTLRLRSASGMAIFSGIICVPKLAQGDVIAKRKANFKANAAAIKAINGALSGGDFETLVTQAKTIANWARIMPNYFPENSDSGDTKARADVWMDF